MRRAFLAAAHPVDPAPLHSADPQVQAHYLKCYLPIVRRKQTVRERVEQSGCWRLLWLAPAHSGLKFNLRRVPQQRRRRVVQTIAGPTLIILTGASANADGAGAGKDPHRKKREAGSLAFLVLSRNSVETLGAREECEGC